jgi:hypothetical protein
LWVGDVLPKLDMNLKFQKLVSTVGLVDRSIFEAKEIFFFLIEQLIDIARMKRKSHVLRPQRTICAGLRVKI